MTDWSHTILLFGFVATSMIAGYRLNKLSERVQALEKKLAEINHAQDTASD